MVNSSNNAVRRIRLGRGVGLFRTMMLSGHGGVVVTVVVGGGCVIIGGLAVARVGFDVVGERATRLLRYRRT